MGAIRTSEAIHSAEFCITSSLARASTKSSSKVHRQPPNNVMLNNVRRLTRLTESKALGDYPPRLLLSRPGGFLVLNPSVTHETNGSSADTQELLRLESMLGDTGVQGLRKNREE